MCDQGSRLSFPGLFSCCQLKVSELECKLRVPFAVCSRLFCRPFAAVQCFARRNPVGRVKQGLLGNGLARVLEMTNGAAKHTHTHTDPSWESNLVHTNKRLLGKQKRTDEEGGE